MRPAPAVAVEILIEGRVQGVGYRAFAQHRAHNRGVTGYAVNLPDGRVKVRAEGDRTHLDGFVHDLEVGPPLARVESVTVTSLPYSGQYRDFSIRFSDGR